MKNPTLLYSFVGLSVVSLLAGCGSSSDSGTTLADIPAASLEELTTSYTIESGASMQQLDMLVMQGASAIDEATPFITSTEPKSRWLAVYVIGRVGDHDSVAPLLPLLQDDNEVVRISAAGTLANKGYKEALPVLMAGVDSTGVIEYLHPQPDISSFCQTVLTTYTDQTLTTTAEWEQWWNSTGSSVEWDATQEKYL